MASPKVSILTREKISNAAKSFEWHRQLPKWTVIVEGRELPARPLVLDAAGVPPNDPTNSHQAVAILQGCGFDVRYQGKTLQTDEQTDSPSIDEQIDALHGCCRSEGESLVEVREREHKLEKHAL
jgi:hypothetical protein